MREQSVGEGSDCWKGSLLSSDTPYFMVYTLAVKTLTRSGNGGFPRVSLSGRTSRLLELRKEKREEKDSLIRESD